MKRNPKTIILITITIIGLIVALTGCGSESDSSSESQLAAVQRGDLTIDITAVGNLALSLKEDLAFEMDGTVEEVLVEEGDSVEEGQLLAKLDTSEWEDSIEELEDYVKLAERDVTTKERAVTAAERKVITERLALLQAQNNLETAEDSLDAVEEVAELKNKKEDAEFDLRIAQVMLTKAGTLDERNIWSYEITSLTQYIAEIEEELAEILAGGSGQLTEDEELAVEMKKLEIELAEWDLKDAEIAVKDAEQGIEDAEDDLEDAEKAVEDAKEALDEALNTSPQVVAPFAGFITKVNVEGGDEIKKGTVAVVVADPDKFEADILVGETDIFYVELGGEAWVEVDAVSGLSLPATVTHISPTATIQSGVVNYTVKVELESLEAYLQEQQEAMQEQREAMQEQQEAMPEDGQGMMPGELPEELQQAIEEGSITEEQLEEMREQMQQRMEEGGPFGEGGAQEGQVTTMTIEDYQLKEGLTVTVSVVVEERTDVLRVLSNAISQQGPQAYITVVASDGTTEERAIQTGISDWQYTEVTDGLTEGEQYAVPEGTTTTTTQQQGPGGGIMIPGMGGFGR